MKQINLIPESASDGDMGDSSILFGTDDLGVDGGKGEVAWTEAAEVAPSPLLACCESRSRPERPESEVEELESLTSETVEPVRRERDIL